MHQTSSQYKMSYSVWWGAWIVRAEWLAIYNSFITSNFNYSPVVWMFTSKSSLNKLENIQKRALRFVCNDFVSNYSELLELCGSRGVKLMTLRFITVGVYKYANNMNPHFLNEMLTPKKCTYDQRDKSRVETPTERLKNMVSNLSKVIMQKYEIYSQQHRGVI